MKIYVGNLSYNSTEDDVRTAFEEYGNVNSVSIIRDRGTGRSKGFAFVEMVSDSEANAAIEGMNGTELSGRNLKVNEARPPEKRLGRANQQLSGKGKGRRRGFRKNSSDRQTD